MPPEADGGPFPVCGGGCLYENFTRLNYPAALGPVADLSLRSVGRVDRQQGTYQRSRSSEE